METGREPFLKAEKLAHQGNFADIHTLENNPDYIAKTLMLDYEQFHDGERPKAYQDRIDQFIKETRLIQQYFGEYIPDFHITIGNAEWQNSDTNNKRVGTPIIFMKKINKKVDRTQEDDIKYANDLNQILTREIELYLATFDGEEGLVPEIFKTTNFMYGQTNSDKEPKLYFFDLYPIYHWSPDTLIKAIEYRLHFGGNSNQLQIMQGLEKLKNLITQIK